MKITYQEAAHIIETVVGLWDTLSSNPDELSAMSDHCHNERDEALFVAGQLKKMNGHIGEDKYMLFAWHKEFHEGIAESYQMEGTLDECEKYFKNNLKKIARGLYIDNICQIIETNKFKVIQTGYAFEDGSLFFMKKGYCSQCGRNELLHESGLCGDCYD